MAERRLLELKVRRAGLVAETAWCAENATAVADVQQVDVYFRARRGRLKVRRTEGEGGGTLLYYEREDSPGPKRSRVSLIQVADPSVLIDVLRDAFGVLVEVRKRRRIFRWGRVQVHLDEVEGLGLFMEFERFLAGPEEEARAQEEFSALRTALSIEKKDLVAESYSDLILMGQEV